MMWAPSTTTRTRKLIERQIAKPFCSEYYFKRCGPKSRLQSRNGVDGVYFNRGRIGYKVFRWAVEDNDMRSWHRRVGDRLVAEFRMLWKARGSGYTPKPYCIRAVPVGETLRPAIVMQHISGEDSPAAYQDGTKVHNVIQKFEEQFDTLTCDHYEHNFIVHPSGKVFLIDLDPDYLSSGT